MRALLDQPDDRVCRQVLRGEKRSSTFAGGLLPGWEIGQVRISGLAGAWALRLITPLKRLRRSPPRQSRNG
jgi:hypothetical protein